MSRQFTAEEARQVLALAAERDHATQAEETLTLAELEEAARAAGIDPAHVRTAAADFLRPGRRSVHKTFLGLPVEHRQTRVVNGSIDEQSWVSTVQKSREVFGKRGVKTELGETREWASRADERNAPIHVISEPTEGGTRITLEHTTWPGVLGVVGGVASNLSVGLVLLAVWVGTGAAGMLWLPALVLTAFAVVFAVAASVKLRRDGHREAKAFDEVLDHVGNLVAADTPETAAVSAISDEKPAHPLLDLDAEGFIETETQRGHDKIRS